MFAVGTVVVYQHVWLGRPQVMLPARVVADDGDRVALYVAAGTVGRFTAGSNADILRTLWEPTWTLTERTYDEPGASGLHLLERGTPFEVRLMFDRDGRIDYWYGNLQEPYRRTRNGFETTDHVLDLVFQGDLSGYCWKDVDDFIEVWRRGVYDDDKAATVVEAGQQMIDRWRAGEYPFDGSFAGWRPDPDWSLPTLPADNEALTGRRAAG